MRAALVRRLSQLPSKQKLEALIDAPNARELVRSVPGEELYYAIMDVGLVDTADIVQLASPTQFRTFVDLGAWKRDRVDPHQVLTWLRAARGDEPEEFLQKLEKIDLEVLEYMLRSFITAHDLEENPDVNPAGVTFETPEGKYLLEFHVEGVEQATLRMLLHDLMGQNAFEAVRLIEATRWEVPSELEETAYRFRSARLEDLGFPPLEQAVSLFAWLDPDKVAKISSSPASAPPEALMRVRERVSYLDEAMRGLEPNELEALNQELRSIANAALVAEIQDPGDLDAVRRVGEMVRDYLGLGIEHLTDGDPALAADCVREHESRRIFQVGFSLTLRLKFKVDRLAKEPLALLGEVWLTLPFEAKTLAALRRKRPLRALKVEGAEPVPFRSRKELEDASGVVARATAQVALFRSLLGGTEAEARARLAAFKDPIEVMGPDRVLHAAVLHAVLDGQPRVAPVPAARLGDACSRLFEGSPDAPKLVEAAAEQARSVLVPLAGPEHEPEVRSTVDSSLSLLRDEWAPQWLSEGTLDPKVSQIVPTSEAEVL